MGNLGPRDLLLDLLLLRLDMSPEEPLHPIMLSSNGQKGSLEFDGLNNSKPQVFVDRQEPESSNGLPCKVTGWKLLKYSYPYFGIAQVLEQLCILHRLK